MVEIKLLLNAYFEKLYDLLEASSEICTAKTEILLRAEIEKRRFGPFDEEQFTAYWDACRDFIAERIETYNPIGVQYTFDQIDRQEAFELDLQLNWYDGKAEYEALVQIARQKARAGMSPQEIEQIAQQLIDQCGAYPDQSIIDSYESDPTLQKLPDYIVAQAIEEIVKTKR